MEHLPVPVRTASANQWLQRPGSGMDLVHSALLSTVDGHRNVIQLESVARAIGLPPDALERLRSKGLIEMTLPRPPGSGSSPIDSA